MTNKKGSIKIAFVLVVLTLIGIVIAAPQIITGDQSNGLLYDKDTKTYVIRALNNNLSEWQLISNTDQCLINCEAVIRVRLYSAISLPVSSNTVFKHTFEKEKPSMLGLKDLRVEVYNYTFENMTTKYGNVCDPYIVNTNGTDLTINNCTTVVTETQIIKRENKLSNTLFADTTLKPGEYLFKVKGTKFPNKRLKDNNVEWFLTASGNRFSEWEWWNSTYDRKRPLNFSGTGTPDYQVFVNITFDSDMESDFRDIRILNATEDQELPYWIENFVTSSYADVWIKGNFTVVNETQAFLYYDNSVVATASNINSTMKDGDEFNGVGIDPDKWSITTAELSPNIITTGGATGLNITTVTNVLAGVVSKLGFAAPSIVEWRGNTEIDLGNANVRYKTRATAAADDEGVDGVGWINDGGNADGLRVITTASSSDTVTSLTYVDGVFHKWKMNYTAGTFTLVNDSIPVTTHTANIPSVATNMSFLSISGLAKTFVDYVYVREYNETDRFATVGEEVADVSDIPAVTINNPTNTTLIVNNLTINWSVTSGISAVVNCWRFLDGVETNVGETINGTTNTSFSGFLEIGFHTVNITCQDDDTPARNGSDVANFTIAHWQEVEQIFDDEVLETNVSILNLTIQTAGNVETITANLTYNDSVVVATVVNDNSTFFVANASVTIPLLDTNATDLLFNWSYYITFTNQSNTSIQETNTSNQTAGFAYFFDSILADPITVVEFDPINFNQTVISRLATATLAVNVTFNSEDTVSDLIVNTSSVRNYSAVIQTSGVTANSTIFESNSTLYITFDGKTISRLSDNINVTVNRIGFLSSCGANDVVVFNFTYFNEETDSIISAANLAADSYSFEATFNAFSSVPGDLINRSTTYNFTGANSYVICVLENVTSFKTNADIRYFNESFSTRFHFLRFEDVTNVTTFKRLYLLDSAISSPITFNIREADGITNAPNIVIEAQRQFLANGSFRTVAMGLTDGEGEAFIFLKMNTVFHRFLLFEDGVLQRVIDQGVIGGDDIAVGTTFTFTLAPGVLADILQVYLKVGSLCNFNNVTNIVTCSFNDTTGLMNRVFLTTQKMGSLSWTQVCQSSSTDSIGTITCNVTSAGNGTFYFWLWGDFGEDNIGQILSAQGFFVGQEILFGTEGLVFAIFLIIAMAMVGSYNPVVTIIMGTIALAFTAALGMVVISLGVLTGIMIVGVMMAFRMRG